MATITVRIYGNEATRQKLLRLGGSLLNLSDAFRGIGRSFLDWYSSVPFATEGGIYGRQWAELAASTRREKVKKYPGRGILVASGKMQRGFEFTSTSNYMLLTNKVPYFGWHQTGTGHMPQRLELTLTKERINVAEGIVASSVTGKIKSAGL